MPMANASQRLRSSSWKGDLLSYVRWIDAHKNIDLVRVGYDYYKFKEKWMKNAG